MFLPCAVRAESTPRAIAFSASSAAWRALMAPGAPVAADIVGGWVRVRVGVFSVGEEAGLDAPDCWAL